MKSLKKDLRIRMIQKRDALPEETRREYSRVITHCVLAQKEVQEARGVFCFVGFGSEPDTTELIHQFLQDGKKVYVPKTEKGNPVMEMAEILSLAELEPGHYGILSPKADHARWGTRDDVQVVIVPGVLFDNRGYRIGYGAGFYDRFLAGEEAPFKLAIGYSFQVVESVPTHSLDVPVDAFVSEMGIRRFTEPLV